LENFRRVSGDWCEKKENLVRSKIERESEIKNFQKSSLSLSLILSSYKFYTDTHREKLEREREKERELFESF
jgi:hypothetical protein